MNDAKKLEKRICRRIEERRKGPKLRGLQSERRMRERRKAEPTLNREEFYFLAKKAISRNGYFEIF